MRTRSEDKVRGARECGQGPRLVSHRQRRASGTRLVVRRLMPDMLLELVLRARVRALVFIAGVGAGAGARVRIRRLGSRSKKPLVPLEPAQAELAPGFLPGARHTGFLCLSSRYHGVHVLLFHLLWQAGSQRRSSTTQHSVAQPGDRHGRTMDNGWGYAGEHGWRAADKQPTCGSKFEKPACSASDRLLAQDDELRPGEWTENLTQRSGAPPSTPSSLTRPGADDSSASFS